MNGIRDKRSERGAALIIVLMLVAILSLIAVTMTMTVRLSVNKSFASSAQAQSRWYALGAENLALRLLEMQWQADPARDLRTDPWLTAQVFPLPDETGMMTAQLSDHTACFNINSLVRREDGAHLKADPERMKEFAHLLEALGMDGFSRTSLVASVADWLDSDSFTQPGGAEDATYDMMSPPYRTGNSLFADLSEFRAIAGVTENFYRDMEPFLCVLPDNRPMPINLNLVEVSDAPVLYALLDGRAELSAVEGAIRSIPAEGLSSTEGFLNLPGLAGAGIPDEPRTRLRLWSPYIRLQVKINHNDTRLAADSLIAVGNEGGVTVIRRKIGMGE